MEKLGLYIHIPFCKSKCIYCDFYSLPQQETQPYTDALHRHLRASADMARGYEVDTVYFGGGTPSCLPAQTLCGLLDTICKSYTISNAAEITCEANPDSAQELEKLRILRDAGFNRLSLGMQSADDAELRSIGRIHCAADTVRAVEAAHLAGFDNLSLDLIYGLPSQTMERWTDNLAAAVSLAPEHISCYGLKVEEGTPLHRMREQYDLPDDDAQADYYLAAVDLLTKAGYTQYEISNFARLGYRSRHNSKYWALSPYLGFGPGAHSDFGGERFAYARSLAAYCAGEAPIERNIITEWERASEYVMLGLRTVDGISLAYLQNRWGLATAAAEALLCNYAKHGLAQKEAAHYRLTAHGFLVSNSIILAVSDALGLTEKDK